MDAQGAGERLLGERARLGELMQHRVLGGAHPELGEGVAEPLAGGPGEPEEQDAAAGRLRCRGLSFGRHRGTRIPTNRTNS